MNTATKFERDAARHWREQLAGVRVAGVRLSQVRILRLSRGIARAQASRARELIAEAVSPAAVSKMRKVLVRMTSDLV